jgi:hypothetical protein
MLLENKNEVVWLSLEEASGVQSLIFSKDKFSKEQAKYWAKKHNFKSGKVDEKEGTYRLRQQNPKKFGTMRTKSFGPGIKAVIGVL